MNPLAPLPAPDRATLTPLVRQALGSATVEVIHWEVTLLHASDGAVPRRSVYRVAGAAQDGAVTRPWSLILKVLRHDTLGADDDTSSWAYWKREALVYQAGFLAGLPAGFRPARCYGVVEAPGNVLALWMEDLTACAAAPWPLARYGLAAQHLGRFNGAYLGTRPIPAEPWLAHGWLRSRTADVGDRLAALDTPATWAHPLVRPAFPDPPRAHLHRLLADREIFLHALARLPQTLCHRDTWRGNLFACADAAGQAETVAIDWALVGPGACGEEISTLLWVSLLEFQVPVSEAARLDDAVFYGYLAGLADQGWTGDPRLVRFAYCANAALQWGIAPEALTYALDTARHPALEAAYRRPIRTIVEQSAAISYLLLDHAAEARELLWLALEEKSEIRDKK
jgi:hypothetical protein